jgi:type III secretion system FlhB-like substrate exporter
MSDISLPGLGSGDAPAWLDGGSEFLKRQLAKGLISLATVFTNAGAAIITNRVSQAGTAPKNIGWGTGSTAAAVTDTALGTEVAPTTSGGRTVGTESRTTVTVTNDNYQVAGTVTATGTNTIAEAGLFDAVTAGNCLIRSVFTGIATVAADSIAFTFGLKFVAG